MSISITKKIEIKYLFKKMFIRQIKIKKQKKYYVILSAFPIDF